MLPHYKLTNKHRHLAKVSAGLKNKPVLASHNHKYHPNKHNSPTNSSTNNSQTNKYNNNQYNQRNNNNQYNQHNNKLVVNNCKDYNGILNLL